MMKTPCLTAAGVGAPLPVGGCGGFCLAALGLGARLLQSGKLGGQRL